MQRYQSHKIVEAAKIESIERLDDGAVHLLLDDNEIIQKDDQWAHKLPAFVGQFLRGDCGYFVRYSDGYESWSPTAVFEKGYAVLVDNQLTVTFHRPPGHRGFLICDAEGSYEEVHRRVEDFLRRAFFGVDEEGHVRTSQDSEENIHGG